MITGLSLHKIFSKHYLTMYYQKQTLGRRWHLPWMFVSLKRLIQKKQRVYNKARLSCCEADCSHYTALRKEVKHMLKSHHKDYLLDMISSPNNKKPLQQYIKAQRQEHTGIDTLKASNIDHIITDPAEKANILHKHFKSVFTVEDRETIPNKGTSLFPSLPDFEITTEGVYNILSNCNPYKSPGPDYIHPYALKTTAASVSPMLTHILQQSLDFGTVPTLWKHAYVTLVFKKGSKSDPKNYRPISLTSVVCKCMEHIIVS